MKEFDKTSHLFFILVVIVFIFFVYSLILFNLQVIHGDEFKVKSDTIKSQTNKISAQRGQIYDRNNNLPLVVNSDSFAVMITPGEIPRDRFDSVVSRLASFLEIPKSQIDSKIIKKSSYKTVEVKSSVPFSKIAQIAENKTDLPGVSWQAKTTRNYVVTGSISHVVGYVGEITNEEIKQHYNEGYTLGQIIGKTGIEKQYDRLLQGTDGFESRTVDVHGHILADKPKIQPPVMGDKLVLTIDTRIQTLTEKALGNRVGAAVVLRPSDGEVLAMVSYPYYDQNIFSSDQASAEYEKLRTTANQPMLNRVVNATYPPASTFKTIMSTAVLNEKTYSSDKKIECEGYIDYGGRRFKCHQKWGHGWMDLKHALAESCDVYYYTIGRDYLGVDKIAEYSRNFGFGKATAIDLPSQAAGTVPDPAWKERRFHQKWLGGDTVNMSIGQG
ncbi:MAG: penicillin-binding protein 2, partial [Treponema sp.]|nr:penicillin-binding protein 2 [Treponema sp.]